MFTDQLERKITLPVSPKKIISLVPSQTELLYDLGLREEVAGITKFCIHPDEWFRTKPKVGGTKKIDFEIIHQINPDLIIGNKEENEKYQIEELMKRYPVWMSDIKNLDDALEMILLIGEMTERTNEASQIKKNIGRQFKLFNTASRSDRYNRQLKTVYLIWQNPLMTVGNDTFIHGMLSRCGFNNVFKDRNRYPEISKDELIASDPELILLSSEPFPFNAKHMENFRLWCPCAKVMLVDGELFSWYGSRLLKSPDYFSRLVEQINAGD